MGDSDRQVRYFLKIAKFSSVSKAAEELNISQSGLSRQLAALEEALGKPLFLRNGRGVALTETGQQLLDVAAPAYAQLDAIVNHLRESEGVRHGNLRIATIHTFSYYFVSDLLARFVSQHEEVNLSVMARSSPDVVNLVEKGNADIGFVYRSAVTSSTLEIFPLFVDKMCLITRQGYLPDNAQVNLGEKSIPIVGFPKHYALRRMIASAGLDDMVVATAETVDAMLRLSSAGIGACVLPEHIPTRLLADYGLVKARLVQPALKRQVIAVVNPETAQSPLVRQLLDMARDHSL